MANNLIQIKRTAVSGRRANTNTLANPGELALNMADGILFSTNGSFVFEVGANNTNARVSNTLIISKLEANGDIGSIGQVLTSNGSGTYWKTATGTGTVTQVNTDVTMAGGPITISGTIGVNTDHSFTWSNVQTYNANLVLGSNVAIYANGITGANGQVLTSNGSATYWANSAGGMYFIYSSNNTAIPYSNHLLDTSNGTIYVGLPSNPANGQSVVFADGGGDKYVLPAVILAGNSTINDMSDNLYFDIPNYKIEMVYTGSTWKVFT